ncbi:unnamed protein product [Kluyveromyces dobzhanskii CBS 2104]|uniref:DNA polymerase epsilon subunit D n=1 Tax=Kluyveromyces dobzhanskii CBS 2104 TaxID=1427455 RepID=A0A0A8LDG6_9SACH|nr:unnamed protein product [Kluyveromyces dobzhanskii CBS 2104]
MPPKGWRKDSEGNYPNTSYVKEQEKISIDDLLFPKSIVTSLAKESLQNAFHKGDEERRITVSKDAALAMQRSATVFVNHLLLFARMNAKNSNRKSCNDQDIMQALDTLGLGALKSILTEKMQGYQEAMLWKKQNKINGSVPGADGVIVMDDDDEEDDDEEEEADAEADADVNTTGAVANSENDTKMESDSRALEGTNGDSKSPIPEDSAISTDVVSNPQINDEDLSTKKQKTE